MVEPTSLLNAFPYPGDLIASELVDPRKGAPRITYAGHLYQQQVHDGKGYPTNDPYVPTWRRYRTAEAKAMNASLWFGEWGGDPNQDRMDEYVQEVLQMADEEMAGWAWWSWDPGGWSPLLEGGESVSPNGERLLRVQPRAIAGTPKDFHRDPEAQVFTMTWTERSEGQGASELAVCRRGSTSRASTSRSTQGRREGVGRGHVAAVARRGSQRARPRGLRDILGFHRLRLTPASRL